MDRWGDPNCNHRRDRVKPENCNTGHKNQFDVWKGMQYIKVCVLPHHIMVCNYGGENNQIG